MSFGWINWINMATVVCLILINIIAARKGMADSFDSKYLTVNILEQIGRYGCMALMILPIFTKGWKFGFNSATEMIIWICLTILLLLIYTLLWIRKANGNCNPCGRSKRPVRRPHLLYRKFRRFQLPPRLLLFRSLTLRTLQKTLPTLCMQIKTNTVS